ncbi:hypothetical protein T484DRAFT_3532136 [Baffinella frigidus]|nr:hypothetical protein T484DRAFT_3532136 [Cryptophyta sp. CCMP2293]
MGDAARQFKIKHGVAKRTLKELQSYDKEIAQQKDKVEKMTAEGVEPTDIRQQVPGSVLHSAGFRRAPAQKSRGPKRAIWPPSEGWWNKPWLVVGEYVFWFRAKGLGLRVPLQNDGAPYLQVGF